MQRFVIAMATDGESAPPVFANNDADMVNKLNKLLFTASGGFEAIANDGMPVIQLLSEILHEVHLTGYYMRNFPGMVDWNIAVVRIAERGDFGLYEVWEDFDARFIA